MAVIVLAIAQEIQVCSAAKLTHASRDSKLTEQVHSLFTQTNMNVQQPGNKSEPTKVVNDQSRDIFGAMLKA